MEHVALHTLQAVGPAGAFTRVTAPVTLWKNKQSPCWAALSGALTTWGL